MRKQDGMSLIAILITIPVVLILGAITVGLALGEHGLLNAKTYEEYNWFYLCIFFVSYACGKCLCR